VTAYAQDVGDLLDEARRAMAKGGVDLARKLYGAAHALAVHDPRPLLGLAALSLQSGQHTEAASHASAALDLDRDSPEARYFLGRAARAAGDLHGAIGYYRHALERRPRYAEAMVSLANALKQSGESAEALDHYGRALEINPQLAEAHLASARLLKSMGALHDALVALERGVAACAKSATLWLELGHQRLEAGRLAEARTAYEHAVERNPGSAEARNGLGATLREFQQLRDAAVQFQRAIEIDPKFAEAHLNLGLVHVELDNNAAALERFDEAIRLRPELAPAHNGRGIALIDLKRGEEAVAALKRALEIQPGAWDMWMHLGLAYQMLNRWQDAEAAYLEARARAPESGVSAVWSNLGNLSLERGHFAESIDMMRKAVEFEPQSAERHANLGAALYLNRKAEESIAPLRKALELEPERHVARLGLAFSLLMLGRYREGWDLYEWRWHGAEYLAEARPAFAQPHWDGEPLTGKTIVLYGEQGLGDILHFARYAPLVAGRGARVWILCHPALTKLMKTVAGVDSVFGFGEMLPPFDLQCALMSLPRMFGTTVETIPGQTPYLKAEPELVRSWEQRLKNLPGRKVGLVWSGDPRPGDRNANLTDSRRSMKLSQLAPLAGIPGVSFVSLQKGEPAAQAKNPPPGLQLIDHTDELRDYMDTAALIMNLDLLVTVDTSVAHAAGALGKPVWLLSRFDGCWRWMLGRDDTPWYPRMRLFRQEKPLEWAPVVERLAAELKAWAGRK
jgi:tetratricopeptide (TPR) repeat protein